MTARCGHLMVGSGDDTYDPVCELDAGHHGSHMSTHALDQHKLAEPEVVDGELVYAVVPYTGEAIVLRDATAPQLAQLLDDCREFERSQLALFKREIQDELIARMDFNVAEGTTDSWTWRTSDGWKITADNPGRTEWPVDVLRAALQRLIMADAIDSHWLDDIIVPERYRVARKQLSNLLKVAGPETAAALRECEQPSARPRAVRVERERA